MRGNRAIFLSLIAVVLSAGVALSQMPEGGGKMGGERGGSPGGGHGRMEGEGPHERALMRLTTDPQVIEAVGLSDEQVEKLKTGLHDIKVKMIDARAELEKAGLEQARLMTAEEVDRNALMKAVEKTGEIRTEMAKLRMEEMLLLKETLTQEQLEKAKEAFRSRRRRSAEDRRGGEQKGPSRWQKRRGPENDENQPPPAPPEEE